MSAVLPFAYGDHAVRVVTLDDEPWFVLADLCRVLDLSQPHRVAARLADDMKGRTQMTTLGGMQEMTIVSEAGMYEVVIRSDKPEAVTFRRWITTEVLPSIRKTGSYGVARELTADEIVAQALAITTERVKALTATVETQQARLAVVEPKASAFDRWLSSNCNYAVGDVAKALACAGVEIGRQRLFTHMGAARDQGGLGWIYRDPRGQWQPYQSQIETKRLAVKLGTQLNSRTGEDFETVTVRITPKGATALAVAFGAIPEVVAEALETLEGAAA